MHVVAPKPEEPGIPVFFNVDGVVGAPPAQNNFEDVLLVQFFLKFGADHPTTGFEPEVLAVLRAVQVTGQCDEATINAIRVTQEAFKRGAPRPGFCPGVRAPGTVVDGRVSPARGYLYGIGVWTIVIYNKIVQEITKAEWPRIDKLPDCPPALAAAVIRAVVGVD